jgi:hypothetical protein
MSCSRNVATCTPRHHFEPACATGLAEWHEPPDNVAAPMWQRIRHLRRDWAKRASSRSDGDSFSRILLSSSAVFCPR